MSADVAPPSATASTVADAIDALRELGSSLPLGDGVGSFNSMYLQVTEAVAADLKTGVFANATFLDRLDVNFANLYLDAYSHYRAGASAAVCESWRALFDRRHERGIRPLQFALAGMNAHINHDLPIAVTRTIDELGLTMTSPGVREDFTAVNTVLRRAYPPVREELQGSVMDAVDEVLGPVDDVLAMWGIVHAREAAWRQSLRLFDFRDEPEQHRRVLQSLDRVVALASRCMLTVGTDAVAAREVLRSALATLERFADTTGEVLWGDGTLDGDDDGILGALLWSAGELIEDLDGLLDGEPLTDDLLTTVLSRLRSLRDAI